MNKLLPTLAFCISLFSLHAQEQLVKDINSDPRSILQDNDYENLFVESGGILYFPFSDKNGRELWRTDGTSSGTFLIKDVNPGIESGYVYDLIPFNNKMVFCGDNGASGFEVWITDGTALGTILLKDINSGFRPSYPGNFFQFDNALYFFAHNANNGLELWKTDGTESGTVMVFEVAPDAQSLMVLDAVPTQSGKFYFSTQDVTSVPTVFSAWASDGTFAGTQKLKDFPYASGTNLLSWMTVVNNELYFSANDNGAGDKLWRSDGTVAGTYSIENGYAFNLIPYNGKLIYSTSGLSTHITDGNISSSQYIFPESITCGQVINGNFYGATRTSIVKTDGTVPGTSTVADCGPIQIFNYLRVINDKIIVPYNPGGLDFSSQEPGIFNTANNNLSLIKDIRSGAKGSTPKSWANLNSSIIMFLANDGIHGSELWLTDGTEAGTRFVKDMATGTGQADPNSFTVLGDNLFFNAHSGDGSFGDLWKTNGEEAGTVLVQEGLSNLGKLGDYIIGLSGLKLVKTKGLNTETVFDFTGLTSNWGFQFPGFAAGNKLYYELGTFAGSFQYGYEPWVTDGTPEGSHLVKDINPGVGSSLINLSPIEINSKIVFPANDGTNGIELWVSDGTESGTTLLKDIAPGSSSSTPTHLIRFGDYIYFSAADASGISLWRTDGTSTGTILVKDLYPGNSPNVSGPFSPAVFGDQLFFVSTSDDGNFKLWKSDGTESGTVETVLISGGAALNNLVVAGNKLYFTSYNSEGMRLVSSDGTMQGTRFIDSTPLLNPTMPFYGNAIHDFLYFSIGDQLWKTHGTNETTRKVANLPAESGLFELKGWLYYRAISPDYSDEVFKIKRKDFQSIVFNDFVEKKVSDAESAISASSTASLPLTYDVSQVGVVDIKNGRIKFLKAGTVTITARQQGNEDYDEALPVSKTLTVIKGDQSITFNQILAKTLGDQPFNPNATTTSGLQVLYTSTSDKVAIAGSQVQLIKAGKVKLSANQAGNSDYNAASTIEQEFCINPLKPIITPNNADPSHPIINSSSDSGNMWYRNDVLLTTTSNVITTADAGTYKLKVSVEGCESVFSDAKILIVTALEETETINLYPVPSEKNVILSLPAFSGQAIITIYGMQGNSIVELITTTQENEIDISSFTSGIYIVRIAYDSRVRIQRISKL